MNSKKDSISSFILTKEVSGSKLNSINSSSNLSSSTNKGPHVTDWDPNYDEVVVTIKKSERGFGFELRSGILIVAVYPSKLKTFFKIIFLLIM